MYRGLADTRRLLRKSSDRAVSFMSVLSQVGVLLNIQGPAHGFVSLVESIGCEHSICDNNVFIKSSYTGASTSLTVGSCSFFRNFVRNATVRHIREKLASRVHKCDANGKYGRKDMLGTRPAWMTMRYHMALARDV